ncbi:MAG: hypothetical protein J0L97_06695 [Alphaproteobacteria bacterium]|nr:hypothetical protein [Alphaproteobacteria bacterium]
MINALLRRPRLALAGGATAAAVLLVSLDALLTGNRERPAAVATRDYHPNVMDELLEYPASKPAMMLQAALGHVAAYLHAGYQPRQLMGAEWEVSSLSMDYLATNDPQEVMLPRVGLNDIAIRDPLSGNRLQFYALAAHRDATTGFDAIALFEPLSHTLLLFFPGLEPKRSDYGAVAHTFRRGLPPQNSMVTDFMHDVYRQVQGNIDIKHTHISAHSLGAGAGIRAAALIESNASYRREMGASYHLTLIEGWAESLSAELVLAQGMSGMEGERLRERTDSARLYPATFVGTGGEANRPFGSRVTALMPTGLRQAHAWVFWRENNHRLEHIFEGLERGDMLLCEGNELPFQATLWASAVKRVLAAAANVRA